MEARTIFFALVLSTSTAMGAAHRSANFVTYAPTVEIARQVSAQAERSRVRLAQEWLQTTLPKWSQPCYITVQVGQIGAGGETTFMFDGGEVYGWKMRVQGTLERILDSVIPHEVSHTIFASYFRRPLPRWADEGAATLVEHESERRRQTLTFKQVFHTSKRIPLSRLLSMKEYPKDMPSVLTLYAEGYSLADYLVRMGGKKRFLHFLSAAEKTGWDAAIAKFYKISSVTHLEKEWNNWFLAGSPEMNNEEGILVASDNWRNNPTGDDVVIRSQNSDKASRQSSPNMPRNIAATRPDNNGQSSPRAPAPFANAKSRTNNNSGIVLASNESAANLQASPEWNDNWKTKQRKRARPQPLIGRIEWNQTNRNESKLTDELSVNQQADTQSIPLAKQDIGSPARLFQQEQDLSWDPIPSWSLFPAKSVE